MTCGCPPIPALPALSNQPLYSFEVDPEPFVRAEHRYRLAQMCAAVFPFHLTENGRALVGVVHTAPITVQDRSLRVWVSALPMGESVLRGARAFSWTANRVPDQHMVVYHGPSPSQDVPSSSAPSGFLYLNVLNLVNSSNEFALQLTRCACDATP